MDRPTIVFELLESCKSLVEQVLGDPGIGSPAAASLAIQEKLRDVGRGVLQAWVIDRFSGLSLDRPAACTCGSRRTELVHRRSATVQSVFGEVELPYRTFRCNDCGLHLRPDDGPMGVPVRGSFLDDVRALFAPLAAELPHRTAADVFRRFTGVELSSRGAQGIIDGVAEDLREWRDEREAKEAEAVQALACEGVDLAVEVAMDGVMAHVDAAWREAKVATVTVRRRGERTPDGDPKLGRIEARKYACVLGGPGDLAAEIGRTIREAGWTGLPVEQILGDGAPWIWNLAEAHFPAARQTLDEWHLRQHFHEFADLKYSDPCRAKAWVDMRIEALREDRSGDVLGGLRKMRTCSAGEAEALRGLISYVETNRKRIDYKESWSAGLAVGSGSVEGACKHLVQSRFKRAGMRWKTPGFLNVVELRVARLNGTDDEFWTRRGLAMRRAS